MASADSADGGSKTLFRHKEAISGIVTGWAHFGDANRAQIEIAHIEPFDDRVAQIAAMQADKAALHQAGYRCFTIGHGLTLGVSLTNVGTATNARYVK